MYCRKPCEMGHPHLISDRRLRYETRGYAGVVVKRLGSAFRARFAEGIMEYMEPSAAGPCFSYLMVCMYVARLHKI
jgi:hypothetical protein